MQSLFHADDGGFWLHTQGSFTHNCLEVVMLLTLDWLHSYWRLFDAIALHLTFTSFALVRGHGPSNFRNIYEVGALIDRPQWQLPIVVVFSRLGVALTLQSLRGIGSSRVRCLALKFEFNRSEWHLKRHSSWAGWLSLYCLVLVAILSVLGAQFRFLARVRRPWLY